MDFEDVEDEIDEYEDEVVVEEEIEEPVAKKPSLAKRISMFLEKMKFLSILPFPFIRPSYFTAAKESCDLCPVLFSIWEFFGGYICIIFNCICCFVYTLICTWEVHPLENALIYKWISFLLSVGWICAYPLVAMAKYILLYYGTTSRPMRNVLWPVYLIFNFVMNVVILSMFCGGPSSASIGQAFEFGLSAEEVGGFFVWIGFTLCMLNALNLGIFLLTQVIMFFTILIRFIMEFFRETTYQGKGKSSSDEFYEEHPFPEVDVDEFQPGVESVE